MMIFKEWKKVPGRGWIAVMRSDDPATDVAAITPGRLMTIEGQLYTVTAVESDPHGGVTPQLEITVDGEPKGTGR